MTSLQQYQKIVYDTARACGLGDIQSRIVVGQATHESGKFSSPLFLDDNNAFGMHVPASRSKAYIDGASQKHKNPASEGTPQPYAHYNSLERCIQDLILSWHVYNKTNWAAMTTPEAYANWLKKKGYYQGALDVYINRIREYVQTLAAWLKPGAIAGIGFGVIALVTIIYLITKK